MSNHGAAAPPYHGTPNQGTSVSLETPHHGETKDNQGIGLEEPPEFPERIGERRDVKRHLNRPFSAISA